MRKSTLTSCLDYLIDLWRSRRSSAGCDSSIHTPPMQITKPGPCGVGVWESFLCTKSKGSVNRHTHTCLHRRESGRDYTKCSSEGLTALTLPQEIRSSTCLWVDIFLFHLFQNTRGKWGHNKFTTNCWTIKQWSTAEKKAGWKWKLLGIPALLSSQDEVSVSQQVILSSLWLTSFLWKRGFKDYFLQLLERTIWQCAYKTNPDTSTHRLSIMVGKMITVPTLNKAAITHPLGEGTCHCHRHKPFLLYECLFSLSFYLFL